jgi:hypothetical protein
MPQRKCGTKLTTEGKEFRDWGVSVTFPFPPLGGTQLSGRSREPGSVVLIHMADEARKPWPGLAIKFWCLRAQVRGRFRLYLFPIRRGCVKELGTVAHKYMVLICRVDR